MLSDRFSLIVFVWGRISIYFVSETASAARVLYIVFWRASWLRPPGSVAQPWAQGPVGGTEDEAIRGGGGGRAAVRDSNDSSGAEPPITRIRT